MALKSIEDLSAHFAKLPGIGERTAFRLAMFCFYSESLYTESFANALMNIREGARLCKKCMNITKDEYCEICNDHKRIKNTICVLEDYADLLAVEETNEYKGVYHLLHGLIEPLKGVSISDIKLKELFQRIENEDVCEIILAFDAGIPGDTTANYIYKKVKEISNNINVTRISYGISLGSDIENADPRSLARSISSRTSFED